jgi:hypothetical protein
LSGAPRDASSTRAPPCSTCCCCQPGWYCCTSICCCCCCLEAAAEELAEEPLLIGTLENTFLPLDPENTVGAVCTDRPATILPGLIELACCPTAWAESNMRPEVAPFAGVKARCWCWCCWCCK